MTLYHYCPTASFLSIVQSRTLWLSMLDMSNDHLEGKWVHSVIERELGSREQTKTHVSALMQAVEVATGMTFAAGFCLSEEGDQLSQWRGYADDGRGFAIGFRKSYLDALAAKCRADLGAGISLQKVEYDGGENIETILSGIEKAVDNGALRSELLIDSEERRQRSHRARSSLYLSLTPLIALCHWIKNPAFREEREWRLVSILSKALDPKSSVGEICDFKSMRDRIVPYRPIQLHRLEFDAIEAVVLGPRNITREDYLREVLVRHGFGNAEIRRSTASYR